MGENQAAVDWVISSVIGKHVCSNKSLFQSLDESIKEDIEWPYGTLKAVGKGQVSLQLFTGKVFTLTNVMFVPTLGNNLLSLVLVAKAGHSFEMAGGKVVITNEITGDSVGDGFVKDGAFVLHASVLYATVV